MDAARDFRKAAESRDFSDLERLFAKDAVFHSPVKFKPFVGREMVVSLLRVVLETFTDFRYVGELDGSVDGSGGLPLESSVLVFRAALGEKAIHGIDLIQVGDSGLIEEFTVMVRPLSAAHALSEAVGNALVAAGLVPPPG
ncbi:MAG: hypothetical protein JWR35_1699 [Marmoricola sp.]|jgi:hypothetical protein|nr:hypothetical protein [Marmoricola sp.]